AVRGARGGIVQADGVVLAAGGDDAAVLADGDGRDAGGVALVDLALGAVFDGEQLGVLAVGAAGDAVLAVGMEEQGGHLAARLGETGGDGARARVVDPHLAVVTGAGDRLGVAAVGDGVDLLSGAVELVLDVAGLDLVQPQFLVLTAGEQQLAIG